MSEHTATHPSVLQDMEKQKSQNNPSKTTPCTFSVKLQRVVAKHSLPPLPTTNKHIKALCNKIHETNYLTNPSIQPNLKLLKPESTIARYLLVDPRPIVSTGTRIRLNVVQGKYFWLF